MKHINEEDFDKVNIFWKWDYNDKYADFFSWKSFLNFSWNPWELPFFMANVNFEPGCRNFWHIHNAKTWWWQILICTAWEWLYQEFWKEVQHLKEGSIVYIKPWVKHWHWAKKDSWFSHIAFEIPWVELSNQWLEEVDDEYYNNCN